MTVVGDAPAAPDDDQTSPPERQVPGAHPGSGVRWKTQVEWLALPLALVADIAAAVYVTARYWLLVTVVVAIVIGFSGAFWLWRLRNDARRSSTRGRVFLLNMVMVAVGSALLAGTGVYKWRDGERPAALPMAASSPSPAPSNSPAPAADPPSVVFTGPNSPAPRPSGSPQNPRPPESAGSTPSTGPGGPASKPFSGAIRFQVPGFGNTLSTGQTVSGTVSAWSAGFQVWLFVRPDAGSAEIPQGPCPVEGGTWACANVQLPGGSGTREYLDVVVASDAEAANYPNLTMLPAAAVHDDTQAYKG